MEGSLQTLAGLSVLVLPPAGPPIATERDAADLVGAALSAGAEMAAVPVARLHPDAFVLGSGLMGLLTQKLVNYRRRLAIVGDISGPIAASNALRDFVRESNRGRHVWFVDSLDALEAKLATA